MQVLVTGASGFVGSRLVPELLERGHDVRVLTRQPADYEPDVDPDATPGSLAVYGGDLLEPGSFDDALDGADAAYYLVHSMGTGGDFAERDRRAAETFADAAGEAGVDRVIYLGGLGGDDATSKHLRSRREVERVLADGDYALTVLRAAIVIGAGSASFELIRQLVTRLPLMLTPKWVRTRCQPIAVEDVVAYLAGVLEAPEAAGEVYEIGGPEVLEYREILRRTAQVMDRWPPLLIPVPVLTPRLSSYWLRLVTDVPVSVARPLVEGLSTPVVVTDDAIYDVVEVDLTPFDEAVRRAIEEDPA